MKTTHPPQVAHATNITLPEDGPAFLELIGRPMTRIKIFQHGDTFELEWPWLDVAREPNTTGELIEWLEESGVDTRAPGGFEARVWTVPMFYRAGSGRPVDLQEIHNRVGGNRTVFLCLSGPGFDEESRALLENVPGIVTFAVNNAGHGFRADMWTCVDASERFMGSIWEDGRVMKFVPAERGGGSGGKRAVEEAGNGRAARSGSLVRESPNVFTYRRNDHFTADRWLTEGTVNWGNHKRYGGGRSVMLVGLRIAILLGFRRIYLVGCDFEMSEEKKYWFEEDRTAQAIKNNNTTYRIMSGYFAELKGRLERAGIEVWNCTRDSKLRVFPFAELAEEVERWRLDVSGSTRGMYARRRGQ